MRYAILLRYVAFTLEHAIAAMRGQSLTKDGRMPSTCDHQDHRLLEGGVCHTGSDGLAAEMNSIG